MDISEVAKRSGIAASTLRFYEEKGLITSIGRHGLKRVFGTSVLDRLALISLGRAAGLALDEIAPMLGRERQPRIDRGLLAAKADELDGSIRRLVAIRDGLRHASACPAANHMECPKFRRLLGLAAAKAARGERTAEVPRKRRAAKRR